MGGKRFEHQLRGPGFHLGTWTCTCDHTRPGAEQFTEWPAINVVVEGAFVRHRGREQVVADPTTALLATEGEGWRTSHPPGCRGDRGVYVLVEPDLVRRAPVRVLPLDGRRWLDWVTVARTADLELATALVADVVDGSALPTREPWYVARARLLLATRLRDPPPLPTLAAELRVSPWHLCRTFRAVTGTTPRAYAERLRIAEAVRRIDSGCGDLAELAIDLGFSSHSHLTARYRAVLGQPPRGRRPART